MLNCQPAINQKLDDFLLLNQDHPQRNMKVQSFFFFPTGFLELINNMLTSGMVPALFPDDEKEAIIGQVNRLK